LSADSLLDVLERAIALARAPGLEELDADTLLALAEDATSRAFAAGEIIGADGAAYVLSDRIVRAGETLPAPSPLLALRLEADRWLDLVSDEPSLESR
jgi:hypothetical protein